MYRLRLPFVKRWPPDAADYLSPTPTLHGRTVTVVIRIKDNGPFMIPVEYADQVRLEDSAGNQIFPTPGKNISLCRCGASQRKPFCDSTHKTCGFESTAATFISPGAPPPPSPTPSDPPASSGA